MGRMTNLHMKEKEGRDKEEQKRKSNPKGPMAEENGIESRDLTKKHKKCKLHPSPEAEDRITTVTKHEKETKDKKKKRTRETDTGGGDVDGAEGNGGAITDERFVSAQSDPRFRRMPRRESKVTIDSRFARRMLSDPGFAASAAPVDKRGRSRKKDGAVNPLLHYYLHQDNDEEEEEKKGEGAGSGSDLELEVEDDDDEEEVVASESEESTSTDEEDEDDECSVNSDICHYLMASHEDTPLTENETRRLAVVNMDWDHIKAVDLYVVMTSCLPKGGKILSVAVYPSEFGLKCMEIEAVHGPSGLFDANDNDSDSGSDTDGDKLRTYELNKLRYYYAVVVCDSSAAANYLYKTLDGTELLKTSNVFDLRFIPDSMEFKHLHRDIATETPASYKEPDFHTRALQHSRVKLSWENDEPERKKILRQKFNPNQLDELNEYLASTEESDEDDENDDENGDYNNDAENLPKGEGKKRLEREKLLALLQSGDDSDAQSSENKDMEITFNTELEDISKRILGKKDNKSETVWEAYLRKRKEKKKARKNKSNYSSDDDDSDNHLEPNQPDDFFEEPSDAEMKPSKKNKGAKSEDKSRRERDESLGKQKAEQASRAELELLVIDDQDADLGNKDYNAKTEKAKEKKKKEKPGESKLPNVNASTDPRFSALFTSHLFALDPTDPQYKRSAGYVRQQSRKQEASTKDEEKANDRVDQPHEQDTTASGNELVSESVSLERSELFSAVRSLKRKMGTFRKGAKGL